MVVIVVGFTTTYGISVYHHYSCELCDKVYQFLATGRWLSPFSSTNETDRHDITVESGVKHHNPIPEYFKYNSNALIDKTL